MSAHLVDLIYPSHVDNMGMCSCWKITGCNLYGSLARFIPLCTMRHSPLLDHLQASLEQLGGIWRVLMNAL